MKELMKRAGKVFVVAALAAAAGLWLSASPAQAQGKDIKE
jgi:hypothetical protein